MEAPLYECSGGVRGTGISQVLPNWDLTFAVSVDACHVNISIARCDPSWRGLGWVYIPIYIDLDACVRSDRLPSSDRSNGSTLIEIG